MTVAALPTRTTQLRQGERSYNAQAETSLPQETTQACWRPTLAVNVYAETRLDDVIFRQFRKLWLEELVNHDEQMSFWFMRYRRGGTHLKFRIYCPNSSREQVTTLLSQCFEEGGLSCGKRNNDGRLSGTSDMVLDAADEATSNYGIDTFVWTDHARTPIPFGGAPWLDSDLYLEAATRCVSSASEAILRASNVATPDMLRKRLTLLSKFINCAASQVLGVATPEYLTYHRDWLVRFVLHKTGHLASLSPEILARFDQRLGTVKTILREARDDNESPNRLLKWSKELEAVIAEASRVEGRPGTSYDPFAPSRTDPIIFKMLHVVANQLGISLLDEASLYHALLGAAEARPVGMRSSDQGQLTQ